MLNYIPKPFSVRETGTLGSQWVYIFMSLPVLAIQQANMQQAVTDAFVHVHHETVPYLEIAQHMIKEVLSGSAFLSEEHVLDSVGSIEGLSGQGGYTTAYDDVALNVQTDVVSEYDAPLDSADAIV